MTGGAPPWAKKASIYESRNNKFPPDSHRLFFFWHKGCASVKTGLNKCKIYGICVHIHSNAHTYTIRGVNIESVQILVYKAPFTAADGDGSVKGAAGGATAR